MGRSKLQIPKVCPQCGNTFLAKTVKTVYCCRTCTLLAQSERLKRERKQKALNKIKKAGTEYLTITEALKIFPTSRNTIHRLIKSKTIHYLKISPKRLSVCVKDLEALFPLLPKPIETTYKVRTHIFDMSPEKCYTIGEIIEKLGVSEKSVYSHIREFSIPIRQIGRFVYAPKSEINKLYNNQKLKK